MRMQWSDAEAWSIAWRAPASQRRTSHSICGCMICIDFSRLKRKAQEIACLGFQAQLVDPAHSVRCAPQSHEDRMFPAPVSSAHRILQPKHGSVQLGGLCLGCSSLKVLRWHDSDTYFIHVIIFCI